MKFIIVPEFYTDDSKVRHNGIPPKIQKEMMQLFKNSAKFKTYLEQNISDMGSVCKNKVSHYLKLKINKVEPTIKNRFSQVTQWNYTLMQLLTELKRR